MKPDFSWNADALRKVRLDLVDVIQRIEEHTPIEIIRDLENAADEILSAALRVSKL